MEKVCNGKTQSNGTDGHFRSFLPSKLCSKELFYPLLLTNVSAKLNAG
jgi:hypothetical protein